MVDAKFQGIQHLQVIRFEDLIGDPELVLRSVCNFFGVAYTQAMLQGTQSNKTLATYRRDGFDKSTIDTTGFNEPWLACGVDYDRVIQYFGKHDWMDSDQESSMRILLA